MTFMLSNPLLQIKTVANSLPKIPVIYNDKIYLLSHLKIHSQGFEEYEPDSAHHRFRRNVYAMSGKFCPLQLCAYGIFQI